MNRQTRVENNMRFSSQVEITCNTYKGIYNFLFLFERNNKLNVMVREFYKIGHLDDEDKKQFKAQHSILFSNFSEEKRKAAASEILKIISQQLHKLKVQQAELKFVEQLFSGKESDRNDMPLFKELFEKRMELNKCFGQYSSESMKSLIFLNENMIKIMSKLEKHLGIDAFSMTKKVLNKQGPKAITTDEMINKADRIQRFHQVYDRVLLSKLQSDRGYIFSPEVNYLCGQYLEHVIATEESKLEASKHYQYAAERKHPDALVDYAKWLLNGSCDRNAIQCANKCIDQAMKFDHPQAHLMRGDQYEEGKNLFDKNEQRAVDHYRQAIRLGNKDAVKNIQFMYTYKKITILTAGEYFKQPEKMAELLFDAQHDVFADPMTICRLFAETYRFTVLSRRQEQSDSSLITDVLLHISQQHVMNEYERNKQLNPNTRTLNVDRALFKAINESMPYVVEQLLNQGKQFKSPPAPALLELSLSLLLAAKTMLSNADEVKRRSENCPIIIKHLLDHGLKLTKPDGLLNMALTCYQETREGRETIFSIIKLLLTHGIRPNIEDLNLVVKIDDSKLTGLIMKYMPKLINNDWLNQQFIKNKNYQGLIEFCHLLPKHIDQNRGIIDLVYPLIMDDGFVRFIKQHFDHRLGDIFSDVPVSLSEQMLQIIYVIAQLDRVEGFNKISDDILKTYILVYPVIDVVVFEFLKFDPKQILLRLMYCDRLSISLSSQKLSSMTNLRIPITNCKGNYPKHALVVDNKTGKNIRVKFRFLLVQAMAELLQDKAMKPQIKMVMWQILQYKNTNVARLFRPDFNVGFFQRTIYPQSALEQLRELYQIHSGSSELSQMVTPTTLSWSSIYNKLESAFVSFCFVTKDVLQDDGCFKPPAGVDFILTKEAVNTSSTSDTLPSFDYVVYQITSNGDTLRLENNDVYGLEKTLSELPEIKRSSDLSVEELKPLNNCLKSYKEQPNFVNAQRNIMKL